MKINLKTPTTRRGLKPYREPHWQKFPTEVLKGGSLGFRRSPDTGAETWHARVYIDGKYEHANLGSVRPEFEYRQAYRVAMDWCKSMKDAKPVTVRSVNLDDVIDQYLLHLQSNSSPRNLERRQQAEKRLKALVPKKLRKKKVDALSKLDISAVQREYQQRRNRHGQPISTDSVNRQMTHLIAALNYGHKKVGMIPSNDAWKHYERLPSEDHKRRGKQYIAQKERSAFIKACPDPLKAFVSAMQYLAARPSEIRRLKVEDVKDGEVRLLTYKGNNGKALTRMVPLPPKSEVGKLFARQTKGKTFDEHVFTTETGLQWTQANLAKQHNQVRDDGKFSDAFETYVWRHCRITDWVQAGFPAPEVARLAGTSLEFIQKNYYQVDSDIAARMTALVA